MKDPVEREIGKGEKLGELERILKRDLFLFLLDLEVKRARRYQNFLCILVLRLIRGSDTNNGDTMKAYHKLLAGFLMDETRETDIVGDLAEDKFVVILPYADSTAGNQAKARFETILKFYDIKRNDYEIAIQQICFPRNGTSTVDLVKKGVEDDLP